MVGEQNFSIEGIEFKFLLDIENDYNLNLHLWATQVDELWLTATASLLYKMIEDHPLMCFCNNISDPQSFVGTLTFKHFKSLDLEAGANIYQKVVMYLYDVSTKGLNGKPHNIYISFFSNSTEHWISAILELCSGNIRVGACLNGPGV